jgi:hypothetical protein
MKFEKIENIALTFTAVFSIVLGGTAVASIVMLAGLLSEFAVVPLHAQNRPAVELQAAMTKEQVDGDLKTAIAEYQKIAADKSAPRDVRAKALLHLAGCYEKQGQQAQSVYQQIVRDFSDGPAGGGAPRGAEAGRPSGRARNDDPTPDREGGQKVRRGRYRRPPRGLYERPDRRVDLRRSCRQ